MAVIRTNQATEWRPLGELYLQRSREQIGRYLAFRLGDKAANELFQRLRIEKEQRSRQGAHFGEAVRIAGWFAKRTYENSDGFAFTVTKNSSLADSGIRLEPTKLVFDYGPGASAASPFSGLSKFGPFDSSRFDRKQPRILAACRTEKAGFRFSSAAIPVERIIGGE